MQIDAIIVAAGASERFGGVDKLFADLSGRPVVAWAIEAFGRAESIAGIVIVGRPGRLQELEAVARQWAPDRLRQIVPGGERRRDSVEAGILAATTEFVAIHDGARPLIEPRTIDACIEAAQLGGAATVATPLVDTIKEVDGAVIVGHPPRESLRAVQTPQVVRRDDWLRAAAMSDRDETDDTAMVARTGVQAATVEGSWTNLKITRPFDLEIARLILESGERC